MIVYALHECYDNLECYEDHHYSDTIIGLYSTLEKAKAEMDRLSQPTEQAKITEWLSHEEEGNMFRFNTRQLPKSPQFNCFRIDETDIDRLTKCEVVLYQVEMDYWGEDEDEEFEAGWQWDVYSTCQYGWYILGMEVH